MKPPTIHYEILLFTGNSFGQRQFCSRDENENGRKLSAAEELERACWAGLLSELLPEIMAKKGLGKESFIWNILNGKNFLYITMGPHPNVADHETTIDPYCYLMGACEN